MGYGVHFPCYVVVPVGQLFDQLVCSIEKWFLEYIFEGSDDLQKLMLFCPAGRFGPRQLSALFRSSLPCRELEVWFIFRSLSYDVGTFVQDVGGRWYLDSTSCDPVQ